MHAIFDLDEDPEKLPDCVIEWQGGGYCAADLEQIHDNPDRGIVLTWENETIEMGAGTIIYSNQAEKPEYWDMLNELTHSS